MLRFLLSSWLPLLEWLEVKQTILVCLLFCYLFFLSLSVHEIWLAYIISPKFTNLTAVCIFLLLYNMLPSWKLPIICISYSIEYYPICQISLSCTVIPTNYFQNKIKVYPFIYPIFNIVLITVVINYHNNVSYCITIVKWV